MATSLRNSTPRRPLPGPAAASAPRRVLPMAADSSGPGHSTPGALKPPEPLSNPATPTEVKKKKKKASQEVRRKRREEEFFKGVYGPKDSHIHMITPAIMQKIQNDRAQELRLNKAPAQSPLAAVKESPSLVKQMTPYTSSCLSPGSVWGRGPRSGSVSLEKEFPGLDEANTPQNSTTIGLKPGSKQDQSTPIPKEDDEDGWESDTEVEVHDEGRRSVAVQTPEVLQSPTQTEHLHTPSDSSPSPLKLFPTPSPLIENLPSVSKKKPSKKPFVVSLESLIQVKTPNKLSRKVRTPKTPNSDELKRGMQRAGNLLDSSGIQYIHRGKIREKPKLKKPTKLKLAILKTRALRKVTIGKHFGGTGTSLAPVMEEVLEDTPALIPGQDSDANSSENTETESNSAVDVKPSTEELNNIMQVLEIKVEALELKSEVKPESINELDEDTKLFRKLMEEAERKPIVKLEPSEETIPVFPVAPEVTEIVKKQIHSRKFRNYCDMRPTKELHGHVIALLNELHRFQDRLYHTDPIKYNSKRKYSHGIKEVTSYLETDKLCMIIFAPDMEVNNVAGGLDDKITYLIQTAKQKNVPSVFSGSRFYNGKPIKLKTQVSVIGISDKSGAEELFKTVLQESEKLRDAYTKDFEQRVAAYLQNSNAA